MDIIPPNHQHNEEGLKLISHCPLCHKAYNPIKAKVLEERDGAHLLYIKCQDCHCAVLALVMASAMGMSSIGLITDLQSHEVGRLERLGPITDRDILDCYQLLGSGRFLSLVGRS